MVVTWYSEDTGLPACSLEASGHTVTVGTYKLCPDNTRQGQLLLYTLHHDPHHQLHCRRLDSQDCPGVLDISWSSHSQPLLASAESGGQLSLWSLSEDKTRLERRSQLTVTSGLCLAVEWSADNSSLTVSDSEGGVSILSVQEEEATVTTRIPAHSFEAWTTCFNKHNSSLVYSGGDDCVFKLHDLRQEHSVRSNSRSHSMGVTSMLADLRDQNKLWTGSYDEQLRLWDVRNCRQEVESLSVGGGVWRIKQNLTNSTLLLATMHDGFKTVRDMAVVEEYREHESLAYGADWVVGLDTEEGKSRDIAATCSFYDHLLRVWSVS